jgi:hypothetical protein
MPLSKIVEIKTFTHREIIEGFLLYSETTEENSALFPVLYVQKSSERYKKAGRTVF